MTLEEIDKAYKKIYENAKELLEDAQILFDNDRFARAYSLAQLAGEEISKLIILFNVSNNLIFNKPVNWRDVDKRLRDHNGKNRLNAIAQRLFISPDVMKLKDIKEYAKTMNYAKNISLYAGIHMDEYIKPSDIIDKEKAKRILNINKHIFKTFTDAGFHLQSFKLIHDKDYQLMAQKLFGTVRSP